MEPLLNAGTFIGLVLLLGAGVFVRWIGPELLTPAVRRRLTVGLLVGGTFVVASGLLGIAVVLSRILRGGFELDLYAEYLTSTRHGQAVLARSTLTLLLMAWGTRRLAARRADALAFGGIGLLLLATVSVVSHSGAMGAAPFVSDVLHLAATAAWGGTLVYLASLPIWSEHRKLTVAVRRLSRLGLASVGLLLVTGTWMSSLHLGGPEQLARTDYGRTLTVKLTLVAAIVTLAALNRWVFVPLLERRSQSRPLRRTVRIESLLLAGVLVATGVLTAGEPPHAHAEPHADAGVGFLDPCARSLSYSLSAIRTSRARVPM